MLFTKAERGAVILGHKQTQSIRERQIVEI